MTNFEIEDEARKLARIEGRTWTELTAMERHTYSSRAQVNDMKSRNDRRNQFGSAAADVARRVTGAEEGLDRADAVTAALIMAYVLSRPALGQMDQIGLTALAELSIHDPELARSLAAQLV